MIPSDISAPSHKCFTRTTIQTLKEPSQKLEAAIEVKVGIKSIQSKMDCNAEQLKYGCDGQVSKYM